MKKQCKCGAEIDLDGIGEFARFISLCDPCANKANEEAEESRQKEREDHARARRRENATKEWEKIVPLLYRHRGQSDQPNFGPASQAILKSVHGSFPIKMAEATSSPHKTARYKISQ